MADASCSCLGALPAELVDIIFFEIDSVRALASFITSSRSIYRCFEPRKRAILFRVLQNELGPILTDAQFLSAFPYADPTDLGYYEWIHAMAAVYKNMLSEDDGMGGSSGGGTADPSLQGLTTLCRTLHQINFLAHTYVATQLRSFGGEASRTHTGIDSATCAPLSRTEWLRVLRAFYRRQIVSNAYAPTKRYRRPHMFQHWFDEDTAAITNTGTGGDQRSFRPGLFDAFEPWEVQQIDHANHFITRLCVALRLAREPEDPEVVGASATTGGGGASHSGASSSFLSFYHTTAAAGSGPMNEHEFGELFSHVDCLVRYLREHPSLADAALRNLPMPKGSDRGGRRDVSTTYRLFASPFAIQPFSCAWQWGQSEVMPDPVREQRERDATTVDFAGDALSLVPFAWVDALGGRYANWFGEALSSIPWAPAPDDETAGARYNSSELWRDAGFALWDRGRVEAIKEELGWLSSLRTGWAVL